MKTAFSDFNVNIISATADTSLHDDIFDTVGPMCKGSACFASEIDECVFACVCLALKLITGL